MELLDIAKRTMLTGIGVALVAKGACGIHLPLGCVFSRNVKSQRPDLVDIMILIHGQQRDQREILGPLYERFVWRQLLVKPGLIARTNFLAAVAAIDPGPHRFPQFQGCYTFGVI